MDDELRQQFQALTALIVGVRESQDQKIDALSAKTEALAAKTEALAEKTEELSMRIEKVDRKTDALGTLIEGVKESLEREIGSVRETVQRMATRLDKIAAGAHYVSRLVQWSESQDAYQLDILRRVQILESRLDKKQD